jgi:protein-disulfide isomerase
MKKTPRNKPGPAVTVAAPVTSPATVRYIVIAAALGLLVFIAVAWFVLAPKTGAPRSEAEIAALQRPHAATIGNPEARVTIVEFLDPACSTCREFYPLVKGLMSDNPGKIKLAIRMVAFHPNADVAVRALEAAKQQGKFWLVLENLLASQPHWVSNHRVDPDALWAQLQTLDLDVERLKADMESPQVANSVALDLRDSKTLKVVATPEYFVNGQGLPDFGYEQLVRLVQREIANAYR